MNCCACESELKEGVSECPVCGCEVIYMVENTEEERQGVIEFGQEYKAFKLGMAKVALVTYSYKEENEKIVLDKENEIQFKNWKNLKAGQIQWNKETYARVDREFNLNLNITNGSGKKEKKTVKMKAPATKEFWKVGLKMEKGFAVRLLVGDEKSFTESEAISLM